ncbi:hypothetical protein [Parvibium lacunae]|uniref:Uncharacterized protein n=1 Tax=Parvibium lacunae TaxID=1888893 RepID=A0A368KZK5_9BURK|nr:hypothetical protein [Parvibium lacunae]RCS56746.1 hypothetical protein DU000_10365 [Parvibium lacunae]
MKIKFFFSVMIIILNYLLFQYLQNDPSLFAKFLAIKILEVLVIYLLFLAGKMLIAHMHENLKEISLFIHGSERLLLPVFFSLLITNKFETSLRGYAFFIFFIVLSDILNWQQAFLRDQINKNSHALNGFVPANANSLEHYLYGLLIYLLAIIACLFRYYRYDM